ncbi:RNA recognition motif domain-containing protein [Rhabdochlamydiaceae symbiont of Dictyostelium giganteum]|uniref:RNA recognition motif domain-containing protein n=1 Tax=Rhabdochlamydiaceae symbiont of Dictyostelium giganteum TaxID=3342349 RepID=UPI00384D5163
MQNQKLYVGSLPYKTSEEELADLFGQSGAVASVKIVTDSVTGQSKGFGFVEMESSDDAQKAIEALNGYQLGGRSLIVNIARSLEPRSGGNGGKGRFNQRPRFQQ